MSEILGGADVLCSPADCQSVPKSEVTLTTWPQRKRPYFEACEALDGAEREGLDTSPASVGVTSQTQKMNDKRFESRESVSADQAGADRE
jgi:hypothetical protein